MYNFIKATLVLTVLSLSHVANAGLITFDTKSLQGEILSDDIKSSWDSNTKTSNSRNIEIFNMLDIGRHSIGHVNINFVVENRALFSLDFGLDAGYGAELFVDNILVVDRSDNLWWSRNWSHSDVFTLNTYEFTKGEHNIDLYFAENCCDGLSSIQLTNHYTQEVSLLSTESLKAASVPEPESIALFSLGLLGLAMRRKVSEKLSNK